MPRPRLRARVARALVEGVFRSPVGPALARTISYMARTGAGTDACLARGALPLPVHFESPVPDLDDLDARDVWSRRSDVPGVDLRLEAQLALLARLGARFGHECRWPHRSDDPAAFHLENPSFSFGCAAAAHALLRDLRPRRVVEVGSGLSSRVLAAALRRNAAEGAAPADYTVVDPYPAPGLASLPGLTRVRAVRAEDCPRAVFDALEADDVLFVDSSHVVRIGGDVNRLLLDVIPALAPGVVVHVHDVPLPFEYPRVYYRSPTARVLWTESYLLQAFLAWNAEFEVLLGLALLMTEHLPAFQAAFPAHADTPPEAVSGSFWFRRKPGPR